MEPIYNYNTPYLISTKRKRESEEGDFNPRDQKRLQTDTADPYALQEELFTKLEVVDLIHFRASSLTFKRMAEVECVRRINQKEITLRDLGIKTVQQILSFFSSHAENITVLDLRRFEITDWDLWFIVKHFPKVHSLHLLRADITDTSCFAEMKFLKTLEITWFQNTLDFSFVKDCQLETLILKSNALSLAFLEHASSLIKLNLYGCDIPEDDFMCLLYCTSLKDLDLSFTKIEDLTFLEALPLERLILRPCGELEELPTALEILKALDTASTDPNREIYPHLESLTIDDVDDDSLNTLTKWQSLKELHIWGVNNIEDFSPFAKFTSLTALTLANCPDDPPRDFSPVKECKSLTYLNLRDTVSIDLTPFVKLPLKTLNICSCENIDNFTILKSFTNLTKLNASYTNFCDLKIIEDLPLKKLYLEKAFRNTVIPDLTPIKSLTKLEKLTIESSSTNWDSIGFCTKLKALSLTGYATLLDGTFLTHLKFLEALRISNMVLEDITVISHSEMLYYFEYRDLNLDRINGINDVIERLNAHRFETLNKINYIDTIEEFSLSFLHKSIFSVVKNIQDAANQGIVEARPYSEYFKMIVDHAKLSQDEKNPQTLYNLARCHELGVGTDMNISMALLNYYLAAKKGCSISPEAFNTLVNKMERRSERGDAEAQNALQFLTDHGMYESFMS